MIKTKLLIIFILIITLASTSYAYYRDDNWECTSRGELSQGDSYGRRAGEVCEVSCCIFCVAQHPFQDCFSPNAYPPCSCSTNSTPFDTEPPIINIINPLQDTWYSSRSINLEIELNEESTLEYKDSAATNPRFRRLCRKCNSYNRKKSFREGYHNLTIKATDLNGNDATTNVEFYVDKYKPDIGDITPDEGYGNGHFLIEYDEDNLKDIKFYYKSTSETSFSEVLMDWCTSGDNQVCELDLNLNSYNGQEIEVYFIVSDYINVEESDHIFLNVDFSDPTLSVNSPENPHSYNKKRILFDVTVDEEVEKLEYEENGRTKRLCRSCSVYNRFKSLRDGLHTLIFRAVDFAGNVAESSKTFLIDSKKPRIHETNPEDYADGDFSIEYTELNLGEIKLFYGNPSDYEEVVLNCPSGKKQLCGINVDLSTYEGSQISYYFSITDVVSTTVTSKPETLVVDTTKPELTFIDPVEGGEYEDRVPINVTLSEKVKYLKYSVDQGRYRRLCSNCEEYDRKKSLRDGFHNIAIKAIDYAGNEEEQSFNILIFS